jgi:hypothetical protein
MPPAHRTTDRLPKCGAKANQRRLSKAFTLGLLPGFQNGLVQQAFAADCPVWMEST